MPTPWQRKKIQEKREQGRRIREGTTPEDAHRLAEALRIDYAERNGQLHNDTVTESNPEPYQEYDGPSSGRAPEPERRATMALFANVTEIERPASGRGRQSQTEDLERELLPLVQQARDNSAGVRFHAPTDQQKLIGRALTKVGKALLNGVGESEPMTVRRSFVPVNVNVYDDGNGNVEVEADEKGSEVWDEWRIWTEKRSQS